jgi:hypothetical protein
MRGDPESAMGKVWKDTDLHTIYVKEAKADAITLGAYKNTSPFSVKLFPSFLTPCRPAPSSFVIYHEVHHCLCCPCYFRCCSFCHIFGCLRTPHYQCQTSCKWYGSFASPPSWYAYAWYVTVLSTIRFGFLFTVGKVARKVALPPSVTPATITEVSIAVSFYSLIFIASVVLTQILYRQQSN